MKFPTQLSLIGAAAVLAISPMSIANEGALDAEVIEITNVEDEVVVEDEPLVVEIVCDHEGPCEEEVIDTEVIEDGTDGEVPIDWVKRGDGENPDLIFYSTGGETEVFKNETVELAGPGKDETGAAIESKENAVVPQISGEKKGPVALIKKGRVFLR